MTGQDQSQFWSRDRSKPWWTSPIGSSLVFLIFLKYDNWSGSWSTLEEGGKLNQTRPQSTSGATGLFINRELIQNNGISMCILEHPITVYNIDGTENKGGSWIYDGDIIMSGLKKEMSGRLRSLRIEDHLSH